MGINNATTLVPRLSNLSISLLKSILSENVEVNENSLDFVIDVDVNWIMMKYSRYSSDLPSKLETTANILNSFARYGFIVQPICDPESRHHSKRASIERRANETVKNIDAMCARFELGMLTQELASAKSLEEVNELKQKQKTLSKIAGSTTEGEKFKNIATALNEYILDKKLDVLNDHGGRVLPIKIGCFQADLLIAKRFMSHESSVILANDTDFAMYVGSDLLAIRDFTFKKSTTEIDSIELWFSSNNKAQRAYECIKDSPNCNTCLTLASNDLFGKFDDFETRALIGLALGCDVYRGGVKGIGPSGLSKVIEKFDSSADVNIKLIKWISSQWETSEVVVTAYLQILRFEPSSEEGKDLNYLFTEPSSLYTYCKEFTSKDCIEDGPETFICPGYSNDSSEQHLCLVFEKGDECSRCKKTFCRHCVRSYDQAVFCIPCYSMHRLEGVDETNIFLQEKELLERRIKESKIGGGYSNLSDFTLVELQDLCSSSSTISQLDLKCSMPVFGYQAMNSIGEKIGSFSVNDGGSFISVDNMCSHLPGILKLLAQFVHFDKDVKYTKFDSPVYKYVPAMFTGIANASRPRYCSGYRLLQRCIRHGTDEKSYAYSLGEVSILLTDENKIAFEFSNKVPASMKALVYSTRCCIDEDGVLLCCQCTCRVGTRRDNSPEATYEEDGFTCVHILAGGPIKLSIALMGYIANELCYELASMWGSRNIREIHKHDIASLDTSIKMIASAALCTDTSVDFMNLKTLAIEDILNKYFAVGTERRKTAISNSIFDSKLHHMSIANVITGSTHKRACKLLHQGDSRKKARASEYETCQSFEPNYCQILTSWSMLDGFVPGKNLPYVGNKLVALRAEPFFPTNHLKSSEFDQLMIAARIRTDSNERKNLQKSLNNTNDESDELVRTKKDANVQSHITTRSRFQKLTDKAIRKTKKTKLRFRYRCEFPGCDTTNENVKLRNLCFFKVGKEPRPPQYVTKKSLISYHYKKQRRWEILDRLTKKNGSIRSICTSERRWCSAHINKDEPKVVPYKIDWKKGTHLTGRHIFEDIPSNKGLTVTVKKNVSRGVAIDRMESRHLQAANADGVSLQVLAEMVNSPQKKYSDSAKKVLPHLEMNELGGGKVLFRDDNNQTKKIPTVQPGLSDEEVTRRTGFPSEYSMLVYIFTVCNGDFSIIGSTNSTMTWYEEWFHYLETVWGKSNRRKIDSSATFHLNSAILRKVFDAKCEIVNCCINSWPELVSYQEDRRLCDPKWLEIFGSHRVVFWDDTNIPLKYKPSLAHIQKLTHSEYYGQNCFKGGVRIQLCGFIAGGNLWTGGVSDTEYLTRSGILETQQSFQDTDIVDDKVIPFLNVLDRGYRCTSQAWRAGKQLVLQPHFTNANRDFSTQEKLCSSNVASNRSGNERAVRCIKTSGFLKDGIESNQDWRRVDKIYTAYAFQVNFMFKPVL